MLRPECEQEEMSAPLFLLFPYYLQFQYPMGEPPVIVMAIFSFAFTPKNFTFKKPRY